MVIKGQELSSFLNSGNFSPLEGVDIQAFILFQYQLLSLSAPVNDRQCWVYLTCNVAERITWLTR